MSYNRFDWDGREQTRISAHFSRNGASFSGAEGRWFESSWAHQSTAPSRQPKTQQVPRIPACERCRQPAFSIVESGRTFALFIRMLIVEAESPVRTARQRSL